MNVDTTWHDGDDVNAYSIGYGRYLTRSEAKAMREGAE